MRQLSFVFLFCIIHTNAFTQIVSNVIASVENEKVTIKYDLSGEKDDLFTIQLFYSTGTDNLFTKELKDENGTISKIEYPGKAKSIVWNPKTELGDFDGTLKFKVLATRTVNTISNDNLTFAIKEIKYGENQSLLVYFYIIPKKELSFAIENTSVFTDKAGTAYKIVAGKLGELPFDQEQKLLPYNVYSGNLRLGLTTYHSYKVTSSSFKTILIKLFDNSILYFPPGTNIKVQK
jgi:hypothetical protein